MKYHEVSFKASHNSFDRDEPSHEQLNFFPNNPSRCGCGAYPLAHYLGLLLSFHLNNPNHDPILITIDIKSSGNKLPFPHEIDGYLTRFYNKSPLFTNIKSRLCFADKDVDDDDPNIFIPIRGNFVFFLKESYYKSI